MNNVFNEMIDPKPKACKNKLNSLSIHIRYLLALSQLCEECRKNLFRHDNTSTLMGSRLRLPIKVRPTLLGFPLRESVFASPKPQYWTHIKLDININKKIFDVDKI